MISPSSTDDMAGLVAGAHVTVDGLALKNAGWKWQALNPDKPMTKEQAIRCARRGVCCEDTLTAAIHCQLDCCLTAACLRPANHDHCWKPYSIAPPTRFSFARVCLSCIMRN